MPVGICPIDWELAAVNPQLHFAHQATCSRSASPLHADEYFEWMWRSAQKAMAGRRLRKLGGHFNESGRPTAPRPPPLLGVAHLASQMTYDLTQPRRRAHPTTGRVVDQDDIYSSADVTDNLSS
jgi:hypothetical protein